jgi:hypothetical protein
MAAVREYRKCPKCNEMVHQYMFAWVDPDASVYATPARVDNDKAQKAYEKRVHDTAVRRRAAQEKGRDYSACIPCKTPPGDDE